MRKVRRFFTKDWSKWIVEYDGCRLMFTLAFL